MKQDENVDDNIVNFKLRRSKLIHFSSAAMTLQNKLGEQKLYNLIIISVNNVFSAFHRTAHKIRRESDNKAN